MGAEALYTTMQKHAANPNTRAAASSATDAAPDAKTLDVGAKLYPSMVKAAPPPPPPTAVLGGAPLPASSLKAPEGWSADEMSQFNKAIPNATQQHLDAFAEVKTWSKATRTDKEIGGSGYDGNMREAREMLDKYGTPELKTVLSHSGLGHHPEVARFIVRAAKALKGRR